MSKVDKPNKRLKSEEGSGLVLVLMVLMVLAVLGSALGMVTINSHQLADHTQDTNSAYYIAEAGANMAYEEFKAQVLSAYENNHTKAAFFDTDTGVKGAWERVKNLEYNNVFKETDSTNPTATISGIDPSDEDSERTYTIVSTGEVDGKTRVVEKSVVVNWVEKGNNSNVQIPIVHPDTAIIFKDKITFKNNSHVTGDIYNDGSGEEKGYTNVSHNGVVKNGLIQDPNIDWNRYIELVKSFPSQPAYNNTVTYNSVTYNSENPLILEENTFIKSMNVPKNSNNLNIDTKGKTIYLIVEDLNIGANINILGQGKVNLYVTNNLNFSANNLSINHSGNTNQINILFSGKPKVTLPNGLSFNGTLFFESANMEFHQNTTIKGTVITGGNSIKFYQNAAPNTFIIAPNANAEFFQGAILNGTIIANEITLYQNSTVNRSHHTIDEFPFDNSGENSDESGTGNIEDIISSAPATEN